MTRRKAFLILLVLWVAIYLPGLGSTEIKGEEGRRILPAVTMLESGNWLVPYVGGKPFLRKPPLMNWLIAGSFKITGIQNEWTARLPSALAVLALGATMIALARRPPLGPETSWISPQAALVAALMAMTTFGLLAKARFAGAEIEGVYVPLFGIAITCWLAWFSRGSSPWLLWTVPFVFLGLAALAKGPIHLLFFYAIVLGVLWSAKRSRALLHPAHFVGILIMTVIFAAWAVPYFRTEAASRASEVWKEQMANRVVENRFDWKSYALNLPRGVSDLLPWILLAPAVGGGLQRLRAKKKEEATDLAGMALRSALFISAAMYVAILLVPGMLPRYLLPLIIPLALACAVFIGDREFGWIRKSAIVLGVASVIYGTIAVRFIARHDDLRPMASAINAVLPPGAELTVYDPGYQPALFYIRAPYRYAPYLEDIPEGARYILARAKDRKKLAEKRPDLKVSGEFRRKEEVEVILLEPGV
jgi:4-amino-4-deoxy-L-arabinose transferase-like glycosyltransferase